MTRKLLPAIMLACALAAPAARCETLSYSIQYHWGFIDKTAGSGYVELSESPDGTVLGTLHGESIPWGGRIYTVNDTLVSRIWARDGIVRQNVIYENGWYTKPLEGEQSQPLTPEDYVTIHGQGLLSADPSTIEAVTITADMLGYFYMARLLPFERMQPGEEQTVDISCSDGPDKLLKIEYLGTTDYNGGEVYQTVFNYSYQGQMSRYPVTCLIDPASRAPLLVSADLDIGHMEMALVD